MDVLLPFTITQFYSFIYIFILKLFTYFFLSIYLFFRCWWITAIFDDVVCAFDSAVSGVTLLVLSLQEYAMRNVVTQLSRAIEPYIQNTGIPDKNRHLHLYN